MLSTIYQQTVRIYTLMGLLKLRALYLVFQSPVAATGKNWKKTGLQQVFLHLAVAIFTLEIKKPQKTNKTKPKKMVSTNCYGYIIYLVNTHILSLF